MVTRVPDAGRGWRHGRDPRPRDRSFCSASLGYSTVASRDLSGKPRHDVIGHGAHQVGPFLGGGLALVAGTEQHDFVPCLDRHIAGIDHALVHADRARDGQALAADEDGRRVRPGSGNALVVAERNQPERGLRPGHVPVAIGNSGSSSDPFDLNKMGSDGHGRPEPAGRTPGQRAQPGYAAARPD